MRTARLFNNAINLKFSEKDSNSFYRLVDKIKKIAGRTFDPQSKSWNIPLSIESIEQIDKLNFLMESSLLQWKEAEINKINNIIAEVQEIKFNTKHLLEYQQEHAKSIIHSLLQFDAAIDASDTGTGKTYVACAVAKHFNYSMVVVTPKSVIPTWERVAKIFNVPIHVTNYEQYQRGKTNILSVSKTTEKSIYDWNTDENTLIVFDELHRCKNPKTENAKMLRTTKKTKSKVLGLSATIGDNPLHLYSIGIVIGLFHSYQEYWSWAYSRGIHNGMWGFEFKNTKENLLKIHNDLFPKYGSRISIRELGNSFPENTIITTPYSMSESNQIQKIYDAMYKEISTLRKIKAKDMNTSILTEILRARQEIELLKIPTIIDMTEDLLEEKNAIVIFVNFRESVDALSHRLKTNCIIDGRITGEDRQKNIDDFQSDKERVIICNIKTGGVGISLHDLNGTYSRVSLISPSFSAQDLIQSLGRIHRAGSKSPAIQKIIFCADTIEEDVANKVGKKISNIQHINDGDLANETLTHLFEQ